MNIFNWVKFRKATMVYNNLLVSPLTDSALLGTVVNSKQAICPQYLAVCCLIKKIYDLSRSTAPFHAAVFPPLTLMNTQTTKLAVRGTSSLSNLPPQLLINTSLLTVGWRSSVACDTIPAKLGIWCYIICALISVVTVNVMFEVFTSLDYYLSQSDRIIFIASCFH